MENAERKYSKSRIERKCGICWKPINKGDEYRMVSYKRDPWPICRKCDEA